MVPRVFHFVFGLRPQRKPFHLLHYLCLESCLRVNRPDRMVLHYRHEPWGPYWDIVRPRLELRQAGGVSRLADVDYGGHDRPWFHYAHESDFIRLERIVEEGGVYADMDTLFVNPLPEALFAKPFVMGREQDFRAAPGSAPEPSVCNAFLMSAPGSDFGRLWLDRIGGAFDGSWSAHSCQLPQALSVERPDWVHIEPMRSFYKHTCSVEGVRMLFEGCDPDFDGVYSMHLWHHMWAAWWRRDFTRFHEGRLTEEYLLSAGSTYSIAARRFLPGSHDDAVASAAPRGVVSRVAARDMWMTRAGLFLASRLERLRTLRHAG